MPVSGGTFKVHDGRAGAAGQRRAAGRAAGLGVVVAVCVGLVCVCAVALGGVGGGRGELLEARLDERDMAKDIRQRKLDAIRRVSSAQLVADIKKVLVDVEATLQRKRLRRMKRVAHAGGQKMAAPESPDVKKNLQSVDHIMDSLEDLVRKNPVTRTSGPSSSSAAFAALHEHVRGRLSSGGGGLPTPKPRKIVKQDAKQRAIAAKMSALQEQIQNDFKKVTGYGKQAGYVPPPKIPHV